MHIPDGFLDVKTWTVMGAASVAAVGTALYKIRKDEHYSEKIPMIGMISAFIFASQMINFPIAGATSGHLGGAALASILFGPWISMLVMATVVIIQCLFFQDGGITALGANVFNMGVIGSFVGYGVYLLFRSVPWKWLRTAGIFLAAWLAVEVSAAAVSVELAVSGTVSLDVAMKAMLSWHALIGIGEGIITVAVTAFFMERRRAAQPLAFRKEVRR